MLLMSMLLVIGVIMDVFLFYWKRYGCHGLCHDFSLSPVFFSCPVSPVCFVCFSMSVCCGCGDLSFNSPDPGYFPMTHLLASLSNSILLIYLFALRQPHLFSLPALTVTWISFFSFLICTQYVTCFWYDSMTHCTV